MQIQTLILQEIIPTTTLLPEDQDFKNSAITAESEDIGEKIAGLLEIINSEKLRKANVCMPVSENVPQNGDKEEEVLINKIPTLRNQESGLNKISNKVLPYAEIGSSYQQ